MIRVCGHDIIRTASIKIERANSTAARKRAGGFREIAGDRNRFAGTDAERFTAGHVHGEMIEIRCATAADRPTRTDRRECECNRTAIAVESSIDCKCASKRDGGCARVQSFVRVDRDRAKSPCAIAGQGCSSIEDRCARAARISICAAIRKIAGQGQTAARTNRQGRAHVNRQPGERNGSRDDWLRSAGLNLRAVG